jgi:non-ribosomal peptide synthase protein (TIGR01720 family)
LLRFSISKTDSARILRQIHDAYRTNVNDILLAALAMAVNRHFNLSQIQVDLEGHGREEIGADTGRTIGWFTTIYPVLFNTGDTALSSFIIDVKEKLHRVPRNGLHFLLHPRQNGDLSANCSSIAFNYLGQFETDISGKSFEVERGLSFETIASNENRLYDLELTCIVYDGCLNFTIAFSGKQYRETAMKAFADCYQESLLEIAGHCSQIFQPVTTPSDLTFKGLTMAELNGLMRYWMNSHRIILSRPLSTSTET